MSFPAPGQDQNQEPDPSLLEQLENFMPIFEVSLFVLQFRCYELKLQNNLQINPNYKKPGRQRTVGGNPTSGFARGSAW